VHAGFGKRPGKTEQPQQLSPRPGPTFTNRAARVMAAGHGGQILLAESTAGLLSGVDLVDLGPRRLRDLPTAVQVFQVQAAGLRTEFPPLRALDASPGNLRAATTSFVGPDRMGDGGQELLLIWTNSE
jgi:hypothetical protein